VATKRIAILIPAWLSLQIGVLFVNHAWAKLHDVAEISPIECGYSEKQAKEESI